MHVVFDNREEAGRKLAKRLENFHSSDAVIVGIPKGGIPVAMAAAQKLMLQWNALVVNKLPVPWNPEANFGAAAADGSFVLNEPMIHGMQLRKHQIDAVMAKAHENAAQVAECYSQIKPFPDISGKFVIVMDDGLASGYTMLAAIKSLSSRSPAKIAAASPVVSRFAARLISVAVAECFFEEVSPAVPFAISDYYLDPHYLTDTEIKQMLKSA